jgi:hypothetical protein
MNEAKAQEPKSTTHIALGILVGAGINQQPHTVRVTILRGTHQRGGCIVLRAGIVGAEISATVMAHRNTKPTRKQNANETAIHQQTDSQTLSTNTVSWNWIENEIEYIGNRKSQQIEIGKTKQKTDGWLGSNTDIERKQMAAT